MQKIIPTDPVNKYFKFNYSHYVYVHMQKTIPEDPVNKDFNHCHYV